MYVYALIPLGAARGNSTPTFMNLTFMVDSHLPGIYLSSHHVPSRAHVTHRSMEKVRTPSLTFNLFIEVNHSNLP